MQQAEVAVFLIELRILYRRFHIGIGACGCCHSPWLYDIADGKIDGAIEHLREEEAAMREQEAAKRG